MKAPLKARPGPLLSNLATAVAAVLLVLFALEAAVRFFWADAPASTISADTLPVLQVRDPEILYRLIPGASGRFNGTEIKVNSLGLRDRDYTIPAPAGTHRILVLGDSVVFGVGLRPDQTIPGQLSRILAPTEVINAGVFGYNLTQEIALLRDVGLRYRPEVVVSCFVHNDIENWGLGDGGAVPEIKSSRFEPPPRDAWSSRLADLLLPDTFDTDRLNLLPRAGGGARGFLASHSRLYLFTYLRLRTHSWNLTQGETRDPLVGSPACQAERVIWEPLRERYRAMRATVEAASARLVVVIFSGLLWEGRPLERLLSLLEEEGIPVLDLTPVWLDAGFYAREYSLGWDPHPSERADKLAAELMAAYLRQNGGDRSPHGVIEARPDLRERLEKWRALQSERLQWERSEWRADSERFSPTVVFGGSVAESASPRQVLYGFWGPEKPGAGGDSGHDGDAGNGWWMSSEGAVMLKHPPEARSVSVEITLPQSKDALDLTPRSLTMTFGAPDWRPDWHPDWHDGRCDTGAVVVPVGRGEPGSRATLEAEIPASLDSAPVVEVGLSVDQPYLAAYLNAGSRDSRLVSFRIRRIALH